MAPIKPNMLQEIYSKFYSILKCSLCAYIYEKYVLVNYAYHRKILVIIKLIKNQKFSFNSIVLLLTIYSDFKVVLQNNNTRGSFLCYPTHLISAENDNRLIGCLIHVCVFSIDCINLFFLIRQCSCNILRRIIPTVSTILIKLLSWAVFPLYYSYRDK